MAIEKVKKVRVVAEMDDPLVVADLRGSTPRTIMILTLRKFSVDDGNARWRFEDDRGRAFEGGIGAVAVDERIELALAIPVHMHVRRVGLSPEFIVQLPTEWHINSLHFMRKKHPKQRFDSPLDELL